MPAKTYEETLLIKQRYADLTEPVFKVLKKALASNNTADKKWAVEQVGKAFIKMIPQDVTSGGDKIVGGTNLFEYVQYLEDKNNNSNKENKETKQEN